jgi:hypothetical protein
MNGEVVIRNAEIKTENISQNSEIRLIDAGHRKQESVRDSFNWQKSPQCFKGEGFLIFG